MKDERGGLVTAWDWTMTTKFVAALKCYGFSKIVKQQHYKNTGMTMQKIYPECNGGRGLHVHPCIWQLTATSNNDIP